MIKTTAVRGRGLSDVYCLQPVRGRCCLIRVGPRPVLPAFSGPVMKEAAAKTRSTATEYVVLLPFTVHP